MKISNWYYSRPHTTYICCTYRTVHFFIYSSPDHFCYLIIPNFDWSKWQQVTVLLELVQYNSMAVGRYRHSLLCLSQAGDQQAAIDRRNFINTLTLTHTLTSSISRVRADIFAQSNVRPKRFQICEHMCSKYLQIIQFCQKSLTNLYLLPAALIMKCNENDRFNM